jgi:hypothetical protein
MYDRERNLTKGRRKRGTEKQKKYKKKILIFMG